MITLSPKAPEVLVERIRSCQLNDEMCNKLRENKLLLASRESREENELLYHGSRMFVPDDKALKHAILEKFHDNPTKGHVGNKKTSELISMSETKAVQLKPGGLLVPHSIPQLPWEVISMDFITSTEIAQWKRIHFGHC